ncbi:serine/threonine-protein kinase RsbW [Palleronia aestuarii]|uniref:Serine/threonine-protein kinase RsbW n=1 Tax=Palleronia aestuarii TaxID=568105 RepID=A0A2W7NFZ5_9RHOB|nr:ATP-binding protein [Palleronia aestuarii]PZX18830.1 serine/threonine-protein kinase RsbW [Palleronia aestuarii]
MPRIQIDIAKPSRREEARRITGHNELRVIFPNTPLAVRDALRTTMGGLQHLQLTEDEAGTVELVLAEVMNNIVEHALAGREDGMVELQISHGPSGLRCCAYDDGIAMPGNRYPVTSPPQPDVPLLDQAEGGFGWFLIRTLAEDLEYIRENGRNCLKFRLAVGRNLRAS